jgi:hypothetical protein
MDFKVALILEWAHGSKRLRWSLSYLPFALILGAFFPGFVGFQEVFITYFN